MSLLERFSWRRLYITFLVCSARNTHLMRTRRLLRRDQVRKQKNHQIKCCPRILHTGVLKDVGSISSNLAPGGKYSSFSPPDYQKSRISRMHGQNVLVIMTTNGEGRAERELLVLRTINLKMKNHGAKCGRVCRRVSILLASMKGRIYRFEVFPRK